MPPTFLTPPLLLSELGRARRGHVVVTSAAILRLELHEHVQAHLRRRLLRWSAPICAGTHLKLAIATVLAATDRSSSSSIHAPLTAPDPFVAFIELQCE